MVSSLSVFLAFRLNQAKKLGKKKGELTFAFHVLAEWTGLEPATPGVTGRYSNQLNYHSKIFFLNLFLQAYTTSILVGADGVEPPTFAL
jgi:hypothetical protein